MGDLAAIPAPDAPNGDLTGYAAFPAAPAVGIIVIQEWWGLVPHVEGVVDRLAAAGYAAVAPDLYRGVKTTEPDHAGKLMMGLTVAAAGADIAATAEWLAVRPEVLDAPLGVMGFCMGGGLALLGPTVSPHIKAASSFYPAMPWPDYHPDWARYAGATALIHQCEADIPSTGDAIAAYADAIAAAGGTAVIENYPGTDHAFFNDDRPEVYDAAAAALAWDRSLGLFARLRG